MDHDLDAAAGLDEARQVAYVAEQVAHARVVSERAAAVVLLELVAAVDAHGGRVVIAQQPPDEGRSEGAGRAGYQDDLPLDLG